MILIPQIFQPYKEKFSAGFTGHPADFSIAKNTENFLEKNFPTTKKIFIPLQDHTKKIFSSENFSEKIPCDAVWTIKKNEICTVKTADCIGGLFYNPKTGVVAAIHAGWKGLSQKIFTEFLKNFPENERKNFLVALSPSLDVCCAEFSDPYKETPHFFHEFIEKNEEKFFVDLPKIAKKELMEMGVEEKNIEMPIFCTKCSKKQLWWSHRRKNSERNLSFIFLK